MIASEILSLFQTIAAISKEARILRASEGKALRIQKARARRRAKALQLALTLGPNIQRWHSGGLSFRTIGLELDGLKVETERGGRWSGARVWAVLKRYERYCEEKGAPDTPHLKEKS